MNTTTGYCEKGCYGCCKGTFEFAVAGIGLGIQVLDRDFGLGGNDWESESFGSFHEVASQPRSMLNY